MRALPPPSEPTPTGGQGDPALPALPSNTPVWRPEDLSRSDVRDVRAAIVGRWPMSDDMRSDVVQALYQLATGLAETDGRTAVAAAKCLVEADKVNLEIEAQEVKQPGQIVADGTIRADFTSMTDAELEAFVERGGR